MPRGKRGTTWDLDDQGFPHGTTTGYRLETKFKAPHCEPCKAAHATAARHAYHREGSADETAATVSGQVVDATERFQAGNTAVGTPQTAPAAAVGPQAPAAWILPDVGPPSVRDEVMADLAELAAMPPGTEVTLEYPRVDDEAPRDHRARLKAVAVVLRAFKVTNPAAGLWTEGLADRDHPMAGVQYVSYSARFGEAAEGDDGDDRVQGDDDDDRGQGDDVDDRVQGDAAEVRTEVRTAARSRTGVKATSNLSAEALRMALMNCESGQHTYEETPDDPVRRCVYCPATDTAKWLRRQRTERNPPGQTGGFYEPGQGWANT